ncbi:MAG: hypothetical protein ACP5OZ_03035 [Candidatus Woesearchaeota archaeon]
MLLKKKGIELSINTIVITVLVLTVGVVLLGIIYNVVAHGRSVINTSINETKSEEEIALKEVSDYLSKETKNNEEFSLKFGDWADFQYGDANYSVSFDCLKEKTDNQGHVDCELLKVNIKDKNKKAIDCNNSKNFVVTLHGTECCKNKKLNVCFKIVEAYLRKYDYEVNTVDYSYYDLCKKSLTEIKLEKPDNDITTICWDLGNYEKQPYTIVWKSFSEPYAMTDCNSNSFASNAYLNFEIIDTYNKKTLGYCSIKNNNKVKTCTANLPFSFNLIGHNKCKSVIFDIIDSKDFKSGKECNKENLKC